MKSIRQTAVIVFFSLVSAALAYFTHPNLPAFAAPSMELTLEQAQLMDDAIWVDARIESDFEEEHFPGAILLNEERWEELFVGFIDGWSPERSVVVYCSSLSCARSHEVATRLRDELGVENVFALRGGWEALQVQ